MNLKPQSQHGCVSTTYLNWGVTLTFDLQNLIRSFVGVNGYFLSVLSKLFKAFKSYCGNRICPEEQNEHDPKTWCLRRQCRVTNAKKPQNSSSNHCHGRAWCWIQVYPGTPPTLCRVQLPLRWIFSPSLPGLTSTNTPPSAAMYPCCSSKFLITTQQHNEDYYYYYYYYY